MGDDEVQLPRRSAPSAGSSAERPWARSPPAWRPRSRRLAARPAPATFSADFTPPLGHALMGGGIAPAGEIADLAAQRLLDSRHADGRICDPAFHERAVRGVSRALREGLGSARPVTHFGTGRAKAGGSRQTAGTSGRMAGPRSTA